MKRVVTILALGTVLVGLVPLPAQAGGAANAALALGAFAAFSVITAPFWAVAAWSQPVYVAPPAVVYSSPYSVGYGAATPVYTAPRVAYYPPPVPAIQREVVYPHGRYVLYGDGVTTAYQWVWIPNPPPPGSAPPPPR